MQRTLITIKPVHLLGFCLALTGFELLTYMASDMIMPAMLSVTEEFEADARHVPNAFYFYLLGGACLQWLIGPLSDHFGRRPLLLIGCALFALSCIAAFATQQIEIFNLLRIVQGVGLGFVVAVSYPVLQEVFREADAVRMMALLGNIALLSPLLGPLIGSLLLEWLTWRELFLSLGLAAVIVWLGLLKCMPETVGVTRHDEQSLASVAFSWRSIAERYRTLLGNHRFLTASCALGLMSLPLIAWIGMAPLLLIQVQGLSSLHYGLWQLPIFAAVIAGNLILDRLLPRLSLVSILRVALWPFCLGLAGLATLSQSHASVAPLVICLMLYAIGLGMSNAALYRLALFASDDGKGLVSAMIGMISIAVMGAGGMLIARLGGGSSLEAFALLIALGGFFSLPLLWFFLQGADEALASSIVQ
ncbi:MFS transporter [Pseudomonas syringae]|nr:MFS transporter [Pseudomonas syringae]MCF5069536.1 MFS transporter [Pseudomonas syringae]